jgi:aspartate/methionine/tyrosine aminotransferase
MDPLTRHEREALESHFNLADGHAQQSLPPELISLLQTDAQRPLGGVVEDYKHQEDRFFRNFFLVAKQNFQSRESFIFHSASQATECVANIVKIQRRSAVILEPAFDNLADIFSRVLAPQSAEIRPGEMSYSRGAINPIDEMTAFEATPALSSIPPSSALFLISPNNPTGREVSKQHFKELCEYCAKNDVLLIIDFCFRFYSNEMDKFDQYEIAREAKTTFLFIEDTGKTFPLHDLKAGILTCSPDLRPIVERIHYDFILTVSPHILRFLNTTLTYVLDNGFEGILKDIEVNRRTLKKSRICTEILELDESFGKLPMSWLKSRGRNRREIDALFKQSEVKILPGDPFLWHGGDPAQERYRISLARPTSYFSAAIRSVESKIALAS